MRKPNNIYLTLLIEVDVAYMVWKAEVMALEMEELIQAIDIVEFISQFVDLTQKNDEYWGLSCFKDEKTPSFSVRPDPPLFFDFSAGFGGNVYEFVKRYYHCSGREAVEILKKYAGYDGEVTMKRDRMAAAIDCKKYKRKTTPQKQPTSKVLPEKYLERYEKRDDKLEIWEKEGISRESIEKFQVRYDSFSNRLVYPIRNPDGEIVNIGGRTLDPCYKEHKLRKYTYFMQWGVINTLYGISENMDEIKKQHEIIIFEGCKSVLMADSWGIGNTAAVLTSHLSPNQMKILAKLGCRVVFALDKGVNIRDDKNIRRLNHYVNIEYLYDIHDLLDEKDSPVDKGKDTFLQLYEERYRLRL